MVAQNLGFVNTWSIVAKDPHQLHHLTFLLWLTQNDAQWEVTSWWAELLTPLLFSSLFCSHNWPDVLTRKFKSVLRNTKRTLRKANFKELGSMKEAGISFEEDEIWEEHSEELVRLGGTPWSQSNRAHTLHLVLTAQSCITNEAS